MAEVVVMPQLGNTVESCLVTSWHVSVGDVVAANTVVADIETDKSAMEVPAGVAGTILALLAAPGDEVPVKAPFFIVGQPGEDISSRVPPKPGEAPSAPVETVPAEAVSVPPEAPAPAPSEAAPPAESSPVWQDLTSEPQRALPEVAAESSGLVRGGSASPRARRVAEEVGVDITQVIGTGPHGRILESDVRDFVSSQQNVSHGDLNAGREQNELARSAETKEEVEARSAEHGSTVSGSQAGFSAISDNEPVPLAQPSVSTHPSVVSHENRPPVSGSQAGFEAPHTRAVETTTGIEYGTGIGGRVTREDVENIQAVTPEPVVVSPAPQVVPAPAPVPAPASVSATAEAPTRAEEEFPGAYKDTPVAGIRKIVAERMLASMATHAQLTFDASASAESLLALRAKMKNSDPALGMNTVTIGDLVAYAAVRVATKFPSINATFENKVLRSFENVHLGLAVDTPRGLLVPTIRYASSMSLPQFSAQAKTLAAQAQSGNINPDLLTGGTFTVTNLGAYGIESFTPILNSPQTAILGVNTILPKPVIAPDGTVKVERQISFSLTVDHCVVDGADAARFLQALTAYISQIEVAILAEGGNNA